MYPDVVITKYLFHQSQPGGVLNNIMEEEEIT